MSIWFAVLGFIGEGLWVFLFFFFEGGGGYLFSSGYSSIFLIGNACGLVAQLLFSFK